MRAEAISEDMLLPKDFEEPVKRTNIKAGIRLTTYAIRRRRFIGRDRDRISIKRTFILSDSQIFDLTFSHRSKIK